MELLMIVRVLLRRWYLVLIPVVVAAVLVVPDMLGDGPAVSGGYTTTIRYTAAQTLEAIPDRQGDYQDVWLASELTVRAFTEWVRTGRFAEEVAQEADAAEEQSFDLDAILEDDLVMPTRLTPLLTLAQLGTVMRTEDLLPGQLQLAPLGNADWSLRLPGMAKPVRVTADPEFFEQHAGSVELWSPGSLVFPEPEWAEWRPEQGPPEFPF